MGCTIMDKGKNGQKGIANTKFTSLALTIWQAQIGTYYIAGTDRYYNWGQNEPVPCFLELTFWGGVGGINHINSNIQGRMFTTYLARSHVFYIYSLI